MHHGGRRLTDFDLDEQQERLRMPEPMPLSWLSPVRPQPPSALVRHLGSAALGLTVGLAIAVPAVLWQKGRIDPVRSVANVAANFGLASAAPTAAVVTEVREAAPAAEAPRVTRRAVVAPVEVARPAVKEQATASAAVAVLKPAPVPPPVVEVTPVLSEAAKAEALLEDARRLMSEGDFRTARSVLEDQTVAALPAARFLLAETYDPNYLAARGVRSVRAEVPRAIELYRLALDGGIEAARQRISALRP